MMAKKRRYFTKPDGGFGWVPAGMGRPKALPAGCVEMEGMPPQLGKAKRRKKRQNAALMDAPKAWRLEQWKQGLSDPELHRELAEAVAGPVGQRMMNLQAEDLKLSPANSDDLAGFPTRAEPMKVSMAVPPQGIEFDFGVSTLVVMPTGLRSYRNGK